MNCAQRCPELTSRTVWRLHSFDHIIALDQSGAIVEQGPFESLKSHQEYIKKNLSQPITTFQEEDPQDALTLAEKASGAETKESNDNDRQMGDWTVYKYYLKSTGWLNATFALGMSMVNAFCVVYSSTWGAGTPLKNLLT
jgi:ATP-binding cassette subfamily C (CFTR/MRP) protein 1